MKKIAVIVALIFTACGGYRPIVDLQGVDQNQYQQDLAACQWYAKEVDPAAQGLADGILGAAFGAALGAALGATYGDVGGGAVAGAAGGGVGGIGYGIAAGATSQKNIIIRCLQYRGYRVLG